MAGIPKYGAKRDRVESTIVSQLRGIPGLSVLHLSTKDAGDILIGYQGVNYLVELKSKGGRLGVNQKEFSALWNGQYAVAKTIEDVLKVIGIENS